MSASKSPLARLPLLGLLLGTAGAVSGGELGIAIGFHRDQGIENHPDVVFADDFEGDVPSILAHWGTNNSGSTVTPSTDVAPESGGSQSLRVEAVGIQGNLYKRLDGDYDELYFRYYVQYGGTVFHHTGGYIGGYWPASNWPLGDAGLKGVRSNGDRLINIGFEEQGDDRLDFYANWIDMKGLPYQGQYYGRNFVRDLALPIPFMEWRAIEIRVELNSAGTTSDGELALWVDGELQVHFHPGSPRGYWDTAGAWRMDPSSPGFEGFLWRDVLSYGLNWVKLQNYDAAPDVWFDDVVVATRYIGPLNTGPPIPGDPLFLDGFEAGNLASWSASVP